MTYKQKKALDKVATKLETIFYRSDVLLQEKAIYLNSFERE